MKKKLKVAFIGCGRIARLHAIGYNNNKGQCRVVALADLNREGATAFNEEAGFNATIYTDYRKMLKQEKPDIVSVCLWTGLHAKVVKACARAGVPAVHSEKPMAMTWGDALSMARAAEKYGTQLTFNHQRRFLPVFQTARSLIRKREIGKLQRIEAYVPANILDWGTHVLDLISMLNRETPARWVMGQIDARKPGEWFGQSFEFAAMALVRYENDVRAVIQCGDDKEMNLGFRLYGSKGTIEIQDKVPHLRIMRKNSCAWEALDTEGGLHDGNLASPPLVADLIKSLKRGKESEVSVKKALRATEIIFAIYESARSRARIDLPLKTRDSAFLTMLGNGEIGKTS